MALEVAQRCLVKWNYTGMIFDRFRARSGGTGSSTPPAALLGTVSVVGPAGIQGITLVRPMQTFGDDDCPKGAHLSVYAFATFGSGFVWIVNRPAIRLNID